MEIGNLRRMDPGIGSTFNLIISRPSTASEVAAIIDLSSQQSSPTQRSSAPILYVRLQRTEIFYRSARATRHSTSLGPQRCHSIFVDKFLKDILTEVSLHNVLF
ncbi:hypothetical protein PTTG_30268 [Puccinia triticina 1-1 BBBD Race 1]|uniref:Uncharacterized protein n=1 Tax=Puccinia triticina (isolate 1-1 / race 1 (BBBD)) TaxID=630390 RepID=A0A180FZR7_PUCT1|nr:hypothetical protein PTTG_30268 [Puccinia triticina 1-1 BBBD Race 1]